MKHTTTALDKKSYDWLEENDPDLLAALEKDLREGTTPDQLYRLVQNERDSKRFAVICRGAARYAISRQEQEEAIISALEKYGVKQ